MNNLQTSINHYLTYCQNQKRLDSKTLKAYRIDLRQFSDSISCMSPEEITPFILENHIAYLHQCYKPKTVKRKIASVKSFLHYLEYKGVIEHNPFNKVQVRFREPILLPKTIPLHTIEALLTTVYAQRSNAGTDYQRKNALRDAAIMELLFATGIRVSELCSLKLNDVDLFDGSIRIYGKGSKERILQLGNNDVIQILEDYKNCFQPNLHTCDHFFINQNGSPLSDQSVRRIINKYTALSSIDLHSW